MLPIPGTSSITHPHENLAVTAVTLTVDEVATLHQAVRARN